MAFLGRRRIRNPVEGHATIVQAWLRDPHGDGGNCRMQLELDVPGVEPQIVSYHELSMVANRWPEAGMRVAVTVDADHPDRVKVHWESVFGKVRGGMAGRGAELLASAAGVDLDLATGPAPDPSAPRALPEDEIPARIAELNAQHRDGLITYEEMAEQIRRALGAA